MNRPSGKIEIKSKVSVKTTEDIEPVPSTPGVAETRPEIYEKTADDVYDILQKGNCWLW